MALELRRERSGLAFGGCQETETGRSFAVLTAVKRAATRCPRSSTVRPKLWTAAQNLRRIESDKALMLEHGHIDNQVEVQRCAAKGMTFLDKAADEGPESDCERLGWSERPTCGGLEVSGTRL